MQEAGALRNMPKADYLLHFQPSKRYGCKSWCIYSCTRHEALCCCTTIPVQRSPVEPVHHRACSWILIFRSSNCSPASIPMDTTSDNRAQQPKLTRMPDAMTLGPNCFLQSRFLAQTYKACTYTHSRCVVTCSSNAALQMHAEAAGYIARAQPACIWQ